MKKPLGLTLAVTLLLGLGTLVSASKAAAADAKPVLTLAFAGYDQLVSNVKTLGEIGGRPGLPAMLEGLVAAGTQGKGLAGLDKARPWGVLVFAGEGDDFPVQGFIPADDLKQFMPIVAGMSGKQLAPNADGVYELPAQGKTFLCGQKGKWAVVAENAEGLKSAMDDPTPMLSDLTKKYLLSIRASVKNVPAATRDKFMGMAKLMFNMAMQQMPDETEEQFALRTSGAKQAFAQFETLAKELDDLVLGLGVDASSGSLFLDMEIRAIPGTKTSKKFALMQEAKTNFAGFAIPGAAMTMLSAGTSDGEDIAQAKTMLENLRGTATKELDGNGDLSAEQKTQAKQLLGDVLDVLVKTVELKSSDAGMAITLDDGLNAGFGMQLAEGAKLEAAIKKLVGVVSAENPEVGKLVKLNAESHAGINFHTVSIPVPGAEAAQMFGDTLQIVIGVGPNAAYIGAGKKPMDLLKTAIDNSRKEPGKTIQPMEMAINATPIAKFIAKVAPEESVKQQAEKMAKLMEKTPGKDRVTLVAKGIPNGASIRVNVEKGLIKAAMESAPGGAPGEGN